jgi:hypothetical protein
VRAYQRPLPLPAPVFGTSRQPVRVGPWAGSRVSSCSALRSRRSDWGPSKMGGCSSCAVQGCRRRTGWWTSSGRRYMGRLLHVLLARRRGRLHEATQRLCSVFFVVVRLLLLANPNQSNPRRRSTRPPARSSLRRPRTRQNWDRPCTSGDGRACRSPHIAANPPSTAS